MSQPKGGLLCEGGPSRSGRHLGENPHMRAPALRRGVEVAHEQELNSDRKTAGYNAYIIAEMILNQLKPVK